MSGDPEQEYFSDGISEDIITTLSKVPRLFVIARNSTFVYKGRAIDVKKVAADQGVRYVLEGSVRKVGNRVRITGQLVDALSGIHLWADHYDGPLDDVFSLQDEITQEIVTALEVTLTDGEQARVWRKRAGDPRVYEHFQRGWALYNQFTKRSNAQAREELETAVGLNPNFAKAYLALGHTYADEMRWGWSTNPNQTLQTASELVTKALELDPDFPDALATLGYIHLLNRSYEAAIAQAEKALELGPSSADTHHVTAIIFNYSGLPHDGVSVAKQAVRLSPMAYSNFLIELGHAHCLLGQYDKAISLLLKVLAETPFWRAVRALLIFALFEIGRIDEARAEAAKLVRSAPRFSLKAWATCHPYRHQADLEHYIGALHEAGLPE
jgi:TolB-like protein/Flp pilus assembly protein TadD